jgi:hypothetical protein
MKEGSLIDSIHIQEYITTTSPLLLIYGAILILIIVYSAEISLEYKRFADSILGRVLGISIVYGTIHNFGWIYGLLVALAFILLLHGGVEVREGFYGQMAKKKTSGKRWWVESILGKSDHIDTDQVVTIAPNGS